MYLNEDSFFTITNIADKGDFDIVAYRAVYSNYGPDILTNSIKENYFGGHPANLVLFQPELSLYPIRPKVKLGSYQVAEAYLWTKCFKTSLFQKVVKKIGEERNSRYMIYIEDIAHIFALYNTAESTKYTGKYAYLKIQTNLGVTSRKAEHTLDFICHLYFVDISIDFARDNVNNKKLLVYFIISLMKFSEIKEVITSNEYHKKLFISCLNRILNDDFISKSC